MKIAIAIATAGRREILSKAVAFLRHQTRVADSLYICPASEADLDPSCMDNFPCPAFIVKGERGSSSQRNAIIRQARDDAMDIIVFFDDDYLPDPLFLGECVRLFETVPDMAIATGHVVADGAQSESIAFDDAASIVDSLPPLPVERLDPTYGGYGCNLAVRASLLYETGLEFDEALPLYGWWEDIDLSRCLARYGRILRSNRLRGVHMGARSGRSPGMRVGYSQVMNLIYMVRKGSVSWQVALSQICKNVSANLVKQFYAEPWIDRPGRVKGNFLAIRHALGGRIDPRFILNL